jgi:Pyruvate/2-oxoacid:ferredoxin oxidoreductase delta subunit
MAKTRQKFYKSIPELPKAMQTKKRKPKLMAVVEESNCTGCLVCVPFCPVDCIETVAVDKHENRPIPPVQIRFNECIGCQICARVCTQLTWDAIRMLPIAEFEQQYATTIDD